MACSRSSADGAFTLLATLLKRAGRRRDPLLGGRSRPRLGHHSSSSHAVDVEPRREVEQQEVPREAITFVDERGADVKEPSPNLEVQLVFEWPEEQVTLREFGLFGGDATAQAGSGVMINHVVHERIDLQPRQRLTRELRLLARAVGGGRAALARAAAALDRGRRRARHRRRRSPHRRRSGGQGHRDRRRARERRPAGRRGPAARAADRAPDEPGWPSAPRSR